MSDPPLGINFYFKEKLTVVLIERFLNVLLNNYFVFDYAEIKRERVDDPKIAIKALVESPKDTMISVLADTRKISDVDITSLEFLIGIAREDFLYSLYLHSNHVGMRGLYESEKKIKNRLFIIDLIKKLYNETKPLYAYMDFEELHGILNFIHFENGIKLYNNAESLRIAKRKLNLVNIFSKELRKKLAGIKFENAKVAELEDGGIIIIDKSMLENEN